MREQGIIIMVQGLQAELKAVEEIDERDDYLRNTGIKVLRFTSEDIDNRIEWVIEQIKSFSPLGETGKGVDGESGPEHLDKSRYLCGKCIPT